VLRLGAGAVGKAHDREARYAALEVSLHLDPARLEPDQSVSDGAREHASTLRANSVRVCVDLLPDE